MVNRFAPLPENFLFGVSSADHQCEAYDPAYPPDIWDWWEQRGEVPQPRGQAIDFWHRYPEFVRLARDLGCNAFRFSISWARIEPRAGYFDPAVLDHYARLAATIRENGMEPVVTLCHYTWPLHVEESGGLAGSEFPSRFARYVQHVRDALGPYVRYWLTFNEPDDLVVAHSQLLRRFPPGAPSWVVFGDQVTAMQAIIRNVFVAHRDARAVLRSGPHGNTALVSLNSDVRGFPVALRQLLNWWVTHHFTLSHQVRTIVGSILASRTPQSNASGLAYFLRTLTWLFNGDWCEMGALNQLPSTLCPPDCVNQLDYLALDFYYAVRWPWQIAQLGASIDGHFERAPVYAPGLYDVLVYFDRLFKQTYPPHGKPIMIMENGLVDQRGAYKARGQDPPPEAMDRSTYIREHVRQIQRARAAGVDVAGYFVWTLVSNREWGLRFSPATDFGLYHLDLDADPALADPSLPLNLRPTPAIDVYRDIIAHRGVRK